MPLNEFQELSRMIDRTFDAHRCPKTAELFLNKKYILPNYRAADYPNQDYLNKFALMGLLLASMPDGQRYFDEVMKGALANLLLSTTHGRPTLFLERELGEILCKSKLPLDLETDDVKFPWPSVKIILPKRLVMLRESSVMYLDIGHLDVREEATCPRDIAKELDANADKHFNSLFGRIRLQQLSFAYKESALIINGAIDQFADMGAPTMYGCIKPWRKGKLAEIPELKGSLSTEWPLDSEDTSLLHRMEMLSLNLLILLSAVPLEYEPAHIERKAKVVGKRTIPALLRARWVGDHLLRARRAGRVKGEITGRQNASHWVSPHWRRQPHGVGFALRKLIWILPYQTGKEEKPK